MESRRNINQVEQTVRAPEDDEVLSTVMTTPSAQVQIDQWVLDLLIEKQIHLWLI